MARYRVDGSVLNDTIQGRMQGAETSASRSHAGCTGEMAERG